MQNPTINQKEILYYANWSDEIKINLMTQQNTKYVVKVGHCANMQKLKKWTKPKPGTHKTSNAIDELFSH